MKRIAGSIALLCLPLVARAEPPAAPEAAAQPALPAAPPAAPEAAARPASPAAPEAAAQPAPPAAPAASPAAPASSPGRVSFGLSLGANFADMGGTESTPIPFDPSGMGLEGQQSISEKLALGGYVGIQVNPQWSVVVEAWWSVKGSESSFVVPLPDDSGFITATLDHRLHYLHIPVLARRDIEYTDAIKPYLAVGGYASVLMSSAADGTATLTDATFSQVLNTFDISGELGDADKSVDIGAVAGAGLRFALGRGALVLGAYYELSLTTAIDGSYMVDISGLGSNRIDADGMRNHGLSLRVGYEL